MRYNLFQQPIIENMDDMADALEDYSIDEFYVTVDYDREEGFRAYFWLAADGEPLAETEGLWGKDKNSMIEDIKSVFGEEVDIEQ
jgi:hypothetical protein